MKQRGFTLIEILVAISIISVLIVVARISYVSLVARARAAECRSNLKLIQNAIENYATEYDEFPISLAYLKPRHYKKGSASHKKTPFIKFTHILINFKKMGQAFAQNNDSFWTKIGVGIDLLTCPADETPPPAGHSYGLNHAILGMSVSDYNNQPNGLIIIGDCEQSSFNKLSQIHSDRHSKGIIRKNPFGYIITKGRQIYEVHPDGKKELAEGSTTNLTTEPTGITSRELQDSQMPEEEVQRFAH